MMTRIRIENDDDGTLTTSFIIHFFVGCSADSKFASMDVVVTMKLNGICIQISKHEFEFWKRTYDRKTSGRWYTYKLKFEFDVNIVNTTQAATRFQMLKD